jgi:hypothetical protein
VGGGRRSGARRRRRLVVIGAIWAVLLAGGGFLVIVSRLPDAAASSSGSPHDGDITALFIGNSFTYANGMPLMVTRLAKAAGEPHRLWVSTEAQGGWLLAEHVSSGKAATELAKRHWDYVVLQEQSQVASIPSWLPQMIDAGRTLDGMATAGGAKTLLYETWAYRNGDAGVPGDSFAGMEARLEDGFGEVAAALGPVTPVRAGKAFALVAEGPALDLWAADGMHPSRAGSYLAACLFYDAIYGHPVTDDSYTAGLDGTTAHTLQLTADAVAGV